MTINRQEKIRQAAVRGHSYMQTRYWNNNLEFHLMPSLKASRTDFILWMAIRAHIQQNVYDLHEEVEIRHIDCSSMLPYFNPIQHVWEALGRNMGRCQSNLMYLNYFKSTLLERVGYIIIS